MKIKLLTALLALALPAAGMAQETDSGRSPIKIDCFLMQLNPELPGGEPLRTLKEFPLEIGADQSEPATQHFSAEDIELKAEVAIERMKVSNRETGETALTNWAYISGKLTYGDMVITSMNLANDSAKHVESGFAIRAKSALFMWFEKAKENSKDIFVLACSFPDDDN